MTETVLSIAGSDPTGGAGIQADLKTMTTLGLYSAAVITCITVQNSYGVSRVEPLHPVLVGEQIESVLADHHVTHIKIGMVGAGAIAKVIGNKLRDFPGEIIYDPVMSSTTGQELTDQLAVDDILSFLISRTTVLTPNLSELETLTRTTVRNEQDISSSAEKLFQPESRLKTVLVTGGDATDSPLLTDYLLQMTPGGINIETVSHSRIKTNNTHGTGCTLSAALASYLCLGHDKVSAFRKSVTFLQDVLKRSISAEVVQNPGGKGPLLHHLGRQM